MVIFDLEIGEFATNLVEIDQVVLSFLSLQIDTHIVKQNLLSSGIFPQITNTAYHIAHTVFLQTYKQRYFILNC